ncbi:hypothetical protein BDW02DRAFT_631490 [Decorospora gaudefroyi]|uniref:BTB domain-containing protein n=1 Tax=Decorospora gaudefroyi TaxID=184978 RepID=A0A6A5KA27_9PLEO|nr:hypothetical protein BDW02DRAFT_631490 [Decorospora gaudefroyi]
MSANIELEFEASCVCGFSAFTFTPMPPTHQRSSSEAKFRSTDLSQLAVSPGDLATILSTFHYFFAPHGWTREISDLAELAEGLPGKTVIVKYGDVLLQVGQQKDAVHVLVSSKVLSLASKVFDAIFNNGFSEGQGLSSTSPREVRLPDDDPVHMTTICKLVHMQTSDIPEKLGVAELAQFAVLCDKYDCVDGVRGWSKAWISIFAPDDDASPTPLTIAYLLDLPREFRIVSRNLLQHHLAYDKGRFAIDGHDFLPMEIINQFAIDQQRIQRKAACAVFSAEVKDVLNHARTKMSRCEAAKEAAHLYFQNLVIADLFMDESLTLASYRRRAADFESTPLGLVKECGCRPRRLDLTQLSSSLRSSVSKALTAITKSQLCQGYCLDCTTNTSGDNVSSKCRIAHGPDTRFHN